MAINHGAYRITLDILNNDRNGQPGPDVIRHGLDDALDILETLIENIRENGADDLVWDERFAEITIKVGQA